MIAPFQIEQLRTYLDDPKIFHIVYFPEIGSTNTWLINQARQGIPEGTVVVADRQQSGRGRLGRVWEDVPQKAILMSFLLRELPLQFNPLTLNYCVAVWMAEAIETQLPGLQIHLKWPNDLFLKGKKLGGILIEGNFTGNHPQFFVVGIGLNVNQAWHEFPATIRQQAISLKMATGTLVEREKIVGAFLNRVSRFMKDKKSIDFTAILHNYKSRLLFKNRQIAVKTPHGIVKGVLKGLDEQGFLLLETEEGIRVMHSGEIFYEQQD